jgi:potassium uptake TrkH family protein
MYDRQSYKRLLNLVKDPVVFVFSLLSLLALILDYGYPKNYWMHLSTDIFYLAYGWVFSLNFIGRWYRHSKKRRLTKGFYLVLSLSILLLLLSIVNSIFFLTSESTQLNLYTASLVFLLTLFDLSGRLYKLNQQTLHPALVFVLSFAALICIGTLLLISPKATVNGIDFIDALFTATSAVCVTGLAVLDTGHDFTRLGQIAIMVLIQLGALGMLSFTSLFALFFRGMGSYESRLNLKNMINADSLRGTFRTLIQIMVIVLSLEALGAIGIFYSLDASFGPMRERLFFSIFHSVSAFCNAGFSTLSNSLYEEGFRYNYGLHLVIAFLIIFGGLGYIVMITTYEYFTNLLSYWQLRLFNTSLNEKKQRIKPRIGLNVRIVLWMTVILIIAGMFFFYLLELDNSLADHSSLAGKLITAFFGSVTTRTAGFNTVDTGSLHLSTLMIVLFLMWIGASPGSTGGGIKTTTFAVATLNIVQQVFGYNNIRLGYRKIPQKALQRASAIISLSLIVIGLSTFLLITLDEDLGVMPIAFECFSAFSTVGLSMGITAQLSVGSKAVIILTMFVGRVGFLTILTGMIRQLYAYKYSPIDYPEEDIFIN